MAQKEVPVLTLDGFSGVGKGTIGLRLAYALSWGYLDSGVFYRLLAFSANQKNISLEDDVTLAKLAASISPHFGIQQLSNGISEMSVIFEEKEVSAFLRTEDYGLKAAKVATHLKVRTALIEAQRRFRKEPGLVADGRDMGSTIFPEALYKFFLIASIEVRAKRRHMQLKQQGKYASLAEVKSAMVQRDQLDQTRLLPVLQSNSFIVDTTHRSVAEVMAVIRQKLLTVGLHFH